MPGTAGHFLGYPAMSRTASIVVSTLAFHAVDPVSILARGILTYYMYDFFILNYFFDSPCIFVARVSQCFT